MGRLNVNGTEIQVLQIEEDDYILLTDSDLIPPNSGKLKLPQFKAAFRMEVSMMFWISDNIFSDF